MRPWWPRAAAIGVAPSLASFATRAAGTSPPDEEKRKRNNEIFTIRAHTLACLVNSFCAIPGKDHLDKPVYPEGAKEVWRCLLPPWGADPSSALHAGSALRVSRL
jgi:hypothetical protein